MLLECYYKKSLNRVVTGVVNWFYYNNPDGKKNMWNQSEINGGAEYYDACIWWNRKSLLYYELQKSGKTFNGERYQQQNILLLALFLQLH